MFFSKGSFETGQAGTGDFLRFWVEYHPDQQIHRAIILWNILSLAKDANQIYLVCLDCTANDWRSLCEEQDNLTILTRSTEAVQFGRVPAAMGELAGRSGIVVHLGFGDLPAVIHLLSDDLILVFAEKALSKVDWGLGFGSAESEYSGSAHWVIVQVVDEVRFNCLASSRIVGFPEAIAADRRAPQR